MTWLAPQREILDRLPRLRRMLLLWRRQLGKTTTLSGAALMCMMDIAGVLVTFASASLLVGREVIEREAMILHKTILALQAEAEGHNLRLRALDREGEPKSDRVLRESAMMGVDDFTDVFEKARLEMRLYHSNTLASRTQIIAPNPATARGWTGLVMIDEIGWIPAFRDLWDAMIWIASREQHFRVLMATTPPQDDSHFSYELAVPPPGTEFECNPDGNWYRSQSGIMCHRVDAWDADAAGVKLLDDETGVELSPDEHRARAVDKQSWDRNMGLRFILGGTSAVGLLVLQFAQEAGKDMCRSVKLDTTGSRWEAELEEACQRLTVELSGGAVGLGFDVATTEKKKSNPSNLTITEKVGSDYVPRLMIAWKTKDERISDRIILRCVEAVEKRREGGRARALAVDSSNEKFYAASLRRKLAGRLMVEMVNGSDGTTLQGQDMTMKARLGKQLVNALSDGHHFLPPDKWVADDIRRVKEDRGSFDCEIGPDGEHGDTFDGCKLAMWAIMRRGGTAWAAPAAMGGALSGL